MLGFFHWLQCTQNSGGTLHSKRCSNILKLTHTDISLVPLEVPVFVVWGESVAVNTFISSRNLSHPFINFNVILNVIYVSLMSIYRFNEIMSSSSLSPQLLCHRTPIISKTWLSTVVPTESIMLRADPAEVKVTVTVSITHIQTQTTWPPLTQSTPRHGYTLSHVGAILFCLKHSAVRNIRWCTAVHLVVCILRHPTSTRVGTVPHTCYGTECSSRSVWVSVHQVHYIIGRAHMTTQTHAHTRAHTRDVPESESGRHK